MNIKKIKADEKKLFNYVNKRDFEAVNQWIDQHVADDFINHTALFDVTPDKEGLKQMLKLLTKVFPKIVFDIKEIAVDDKIIFFKLFLHGMSEIPTMGMVMVKLNDNGKMTDRWAIVDQQQ